MTGIWKAALLMLAAWSMVGASPAGTDADPAGYELLVPIDVATGPGVQRLTIPAQAMVASRTTDLADIRIFGATGRAMPMARIAPARKAGRSYDMAPLPILGSTLEMNVTGVSLRLGTDGRARVACIDGTSRGGCNADRAGRFCRECQTYGRPHWGKLSIPVRVGRAA